MKKALPSQSVFHDARNGRAKDGGYKMLLAVSGGLGTVEPVAGGGAACPKPLATAGPAGGHPFRPRATDRDHLASGGWSQPRLPRLLLLPGGTWTQDRICRHAVVAAGVAYLAASRSAAGGHRRHAHQAIRSAGRGRGHPPQPHTGSRRPKVPLRTCLGNALAGHAAPQLRGFGVAAAGDALRTPQNDGQDSEVARLDVCHQARAGRPTGRVDRSAR